MGVHLVEIISLPERKLEYPRPRCVNLSLTYLTDPKDDAISIEPRTFDHNARLNPQGSLSFISL
jgi:hypothetical protein